MAKSSGSKTRSGGSSSRSRGKTTTKSRGSGKRELISPRGDARFVRRDGQGQFRESDDVGRSLKQDRARTSKKTVKSGYGDRGERKR